MRMRSTSLLILGVVVCVYSPARIFQIRVNFRVLDIFLPVIAHNIFPQVCFFHKFCNLTDPADPRQLESIIFHPLPNNGNFGNNENNI
jgi:hypothetical protein